MKNVILIGLKSEFEVNYKEIKTDRKWLLFQKDVADADTCIQIYGTFPTYWIRF